MMSTLTLAIIDRMKLMEQKISLLQKENTNLRLIAETVSTATTTPTVSTAKAAKEYRTSIGTNEPLNRPSSIRLRSRGNPFDDSQGTNVPGDVGVGASPNPGTFTGSLPGRPPVSTGSGIVTQIPTGTNVPGGGTTPIPDNFDINGDGVVDGADLGWILSNWNNFPPNEQGALLGRFLSAYGTNSQGGGEETPVVLKKSGTTTKDIASLSGQRYIPYR